MKELRSEDKIISNVKRIHMIGIGGSGMCPLAHILHDKGYTVTGSDNNESDPLNRVKALGIKVTMGHFAENVHDSELVVYSAAISKDNPELVAAEKLGIPFYDNELISMAAKESGYAESLFENAENFLENRHLVTFLMLNLGVQIIILYYLIKIINLKHKIQTFLVKLVLVLQQMRIKFILQFIIIILNC